jgi:hypothetical protein
MHKDNLSKMSKTVIKHFTKTIKNIDKKVKFVKRKSKIGAKLFVETLVFGCMMDPMISLERLSWLMKERGVKISKQGIHQRFGAEAVKLMQQFLLETIKQFKTEKCEIFDLLNPFSTVTILDSSIVSLPKNLKHLYKGSGGSASEASLKIQTLYNYACGQVKNLTVTEGCRSDQGYDEYLEMIEEGALYLQDLGYFKRRAFSIIQEKGAYFVSRYYYPTTILDEKNEKIHLITELRKSGNFFKKIVWLGEGEKVKVRLIALRLPNDEVETRVRKIRESAQKKGRTPTKETLELAQWSIYVTNVSETILNDEQVHTTYSLRWQIELFFKLCKSEAGIDKIRGKKHGRVICEIYAKLICVILLLYSCFPLRWQRNREISFIKSYKILSLRAIEAFRSLKSWRLFMKFLKSFLDFIKKFALKDGPRKKRAMTYQKLLKPMIQEVFA